MSLSFPLLVIIVFSLYVCLPLSPSMSLYLSLSFSLPVCLSLSVYLSMSMFLSASLSISVSFSLSWMSAPSCHVLASSVPAILPSTSPFSPRRFSSKFPHAPDLNNQLLMNALLLQNKQASKDPVAQILNRFFKNNAILEKAR